MAGQFAACFLKKAARKLLKDELLQSPQVSNHGIHILWRKTMPETGFVDLNRRHHTGALGNDQFQLRVRLALHFSRRKPGNFDAEELVRFRIPFAIFAMTSGARQTVSRLSGVGAAHVQTGAGYAQAARGLRGWSARALRPSRLTIPLRGRGVHSSRCQKRDSRPGTIHWVRPSN